ncbi:MAG: hypothetical protein EAZ86_19320 [Oscillatoriales cyanobacterium]|nr:MAG: hypothetical protein EAZ86_19320 [Oscillatoriales cyanobacterium]TAG60308.1 MAG: hypothetical protein EAZ28_07970 [Oscillatoriales cyanobacterium]
MLARAIALNKFIQHPRASSVLEIILFFKQFCSAPNTDRDAKPPTSPILNKNLQLLLQRVITISEHLNNPIQSATPKTT